MVGFTFIKPSQRNSNSSATYLRIADGQGFDVSFIFILIFLGWVEQQLTYLEKKCFFFTVGARQ